MNIASTIVNQQNAGLQSMDTNQLLDLFDVDDTEMVPKLKNQLKKKPIPMVLVVVLHPLMEIYQMILLVVLLVKQLELLVNWLIYGMNHNMKKSIILIILLKHLNRVSRNGVKVCFCK